MRRLPTLLGVGALAALAAPAPLPAQVTQQRVERSLALDPDAAVRIYNLTGSVRVEAWDRDSLQVIATISDPGRNRFVIGGSRGGAKMAVEAPLDLDQAPAHLLVRAPARARLWIKVASAGVVIRGLRGGVDVISTSGDIRFEGEPDQLNVETMDGSIEIVGTAPWLRARTASGRITVRGGGDDVGLVTVSGPVSLLSSGIRRGRLESVSGDLTFAGSLARDGALSLETHSGTVDLILPRLLAASFDLNTYQGSIRNEFAPDHPPVRRGQGETLQFGPESGTATIQVRTFKGPIQLRGK